MLAGLCDDASIFPPGLTPVAQAIPAHLAHLAGPYADLVGPLILSASALPEAAGHVGGLAPGSVELVVTVPSQDAVAAALAAVDALPAFELVGLEVALTSDAAPQDAVSAITAALGGRALDVVVEVPRDDRRAATLDAVRAAGLRGKFRTGGVRADLYPDVDELADALQAAVERGVPFKATAGLHHAVRNTDRQTGFDQHGFLNILVAVDALLNGAEPGRAAGILAERDGDRLAAEVLTWGPERGTAVRRLFGSFGTCSISEPAEELAALGLLHPDRKVSP